MCLFSLFLFVLKIKKYETKIKWNKINKINTLCNYMMSRYVYCFVWFDFNVYYSKWWKSWKKVHNSKKSFWWYDFRTKDDQKGLNKQMVMIINKKINDKNNSKLKTIQIIYYEVKQSKMMFLFIFVLFQINNHHRHHRILFLQYLIMNIINWVLYSYIYAMWTSCIF